MSPVLRINEKLAAQTAATLSSNATVRQPEAIVVRIGPARVSALVTPGQAPVLLLHGVGASARCWLPLIERVGGRALIAWDAPGYGRSSRLSTDSPTADDYADRLAGFVDRLGHRRVHVVGHSWGALVATAFTSRYPDRASSLALVSASLGYGRMPASERNALVDQRLSKLVRLGARRLAQAMAPHLVHRNAPDAVIRAASELGEECQTRGTAAALRMLGQADLLAGIVPIQCPLLLVGGNDDCITPLAMQETLRSAVPHARNTVIDGCAHLALIEQPDVLAAVLTRFWSEIEGAAGLG